MPEPLRLVVTPEGETKPWIDPRKAMVMEWKRIYFLETGSNDVTTWGHSMRMLQQRFEEVDTETGEMFIAYPEPGVWSDQIKKYFAVWNPEYGGYFLGNFLKHWGSYVRKHREKKPEQSKRSSTVTCPKCGEFGISMQSHVCRTGT